MPFKLDHVAFQVSHLETSINFYKHVLGLELLSKTIDKEHNEAFAYFDLKGGKLELLQSLDPATDFQPPEIRPPYCPHLALAVEDLDQHAAELAKKGVRIIKGPLEIPGMVKWLYIADPDNNIIEFVQWL